MASSGEPACKPVESNTLVDAEKVLKRHYSTIGIGDVFLDPPIHPLLKNYLKEGCSESFKSWEIMGTIKKEPEDFVVREIFQKNRRIPGLSNDVFVDDSFRVARMLDPDEVIEQKLDEQKLDEQITAPKIEAAKAAKNLGLIHHGNQTVDDPVEDINEKAPLETIRDSLQRIFQDRADPIKEAEKILESMCSLQAAVILRIKNFAGDEVKTPMADVWIPPFPTDETDGSSQQREERGELHRALKVEFPMMKSERAERKDDETVTRDHWIRVAPDQTFDDIIPFLYDPVVDLQSLHLFRNRGFEGIRAVVEKREQSGVRDRGKRSRNRDNRTRDSSTVLAMDNGSQTILRLRPDIQKDGRRSVHQIVAKKVRDFNTSTVPNIPIPIEPSGDDDADTSRKMTTTSAVVVQWSKQALEKASRKRKRPQNNDEKESDVEIEAYPHLLCILKKRQREHLVAIQNLTAALRCRQSDIGLAGIKDMQAVTYQFCTIRNYQASRIRSANHRLRQNGMELSGLYKVDWQLNNGDLEGNRFEIVVRDLNRINVEPTGSGPAKEMVAPCEITHVRDMIERIRKSGFINFYGEQRLGSPGESEEVGTRAFDIGKAMLQQNFCMAIDLLMTGRNVTRGGGQVENAKARKAREIWKATGGDAAATLKAFPNGDSMPRERSVLKGLKVSLCWYSLLMLPVCPCRSLNLSQRYGKEKSLEALRCLGYNMRIFWIHAYQSLIWNSAATERIKLYGTKTVKGDLYLEDDREGQSDVKVVVSDYEESTVQLSQVVLPLPGYKIQYPENEIGQVYQKLLQRDYVSFDQNAPAEATAKGSYRRLITLPDNLDVSFDVLDESSARTSNSMKLKFDLPKGCYATVLMRELFLSTATRSDNQAEALE
jgi:TruD family tRNA pseudouridine synthase